MKHENEEALLLVVIQEHSEVAQLTSLNRTFLAGVSLLRVAKTLPPLSSKLICLSFLTGVLGEGNYNCSATDMITSSIEGLPSPMSVVSAGRKSASVNMDGSIGHIPVAWRCCCL